MMSKSVLYKGCKALLAPWDINCVPELCGRGTARPARKSGSREGPIAGGPRRQAAACSSVFVFGYGRYAGVSQSTWCMWGSFSPYV